MKVRVLQGQSICFRGIWHNQGDVLEVPEKTEFVKNVPCYDQDGKYLGDEIVSQVEVIPEPEAPKSKNKKEEG